jgi:GNAT superfamily N-acetyltransferase
MTKRALRIERTTEKDVPLILKFILELADYEKLSDSVTATEERLRTALFGPQPLAQAVIAYDGEEPVAFAVYFLTYSTFSSRPGIYLEDIYVRPPHRGFGVGRQLFIFLAREAIERGCARLELAVLNWNEQAIGFYEKLGAKPNNEWTMYRLSETNLQKLAAETSSIL